jgi:hypothetical protein
MMVRVKTNYAGPLMYQMDSPTLKDVLIKLSDKVPICSFEDQHVQGDFKVHVNGIEYECLERGIDTPLKEEDEVEVSLIILGGG